MNRNVLVVSGTVFAIGLGWALFKKSPSSFQKPSASMTSRPLRNVANAPILKKNDGKPASGLRNVASAESLKKPVPTNLAKSLQSYQGLHAKTFLTADEEQEKNEMLRNPAFLEDLRGVLSDTSMMEDPEYEKLENAAMDLIVEALQYGDRQASLQVIQDIIQDPQVENPDLPQKVRETLAGIKGELLYHAVAFAPGEFSNVESLLPGVVSQRIWRNVQAKHQQNLNESQIEVQEHQTKSR